MQAGIIILITVALTLFRYRRCSGYYNHTLTAYGALDKQPGMDKKIIVEELPVFLNDQQRAVSATIDECDLWCRKNIDGYQPLPEKLGFSASDCKNIEEQFVSAIRINPLAHYNNYLQVVNERETVAGRHMEWQDVYEANYKYPFPYIALEPGATATALAVIATAADEPDYGLDMQLWSDNGSVAGESYGFGKQRFADKTDAVQSQVPFHLNFLHDRLLRKLSPALRTSYGLYRIKTFGALARLALETGHDYWACRFAGWALHYVQDLTVPFHAAMSPGYSFFQIMLASGLKSIGYGRMYENIFMDIAGLHVLFEVIHYELLKDVFSHRDFGGIVYQSLQGGVTGDYSALSPEQYVRDVVARQAYNMRYRAYYAVKGVVADETAFSKIMIDSAAAIYDSSRIRRGTTQAAEGELREVMLRVIANSGIHSRNYIQALLNNAAW